MTAVLLAGCDDVETGNLSTPAESPVEEAQSSVLPQMPEFVLPDNWNEQHPVFSPNAKFEAHYIGLAEKEIQWSSGDGKGSVRLDALTAIGPEGESPTWRRGKDGRSPPSVPAASIQRIEFSFEVGEHGIDDGGLIFVMPEPFWSWTEAQVTDSNAPGYTTATPRGVGVELVPGSQGAEFLVEGRALEAGERIDIVLGAGRLGTRVDEFAERGSEILIAVDADGDGTRRWLEESVQIDVAARAGVQIVALGPGEVAPGDPIEVSVSILDANGNRARWPETSGIESSRAQISFEIERTDGAALAGLGLAETITGFTDPDDPYRFRFSAPDREEVIRLSIHGRGELKGFDAEVNPIMVRTSPARLVWGDLHGHTRFSDGTGTPEDYFSYARDVARLDVIALTDHDHWGVRPLDDYPARAERIVQTALRFNDPGRFVTILGYEWTSWLHGHRHVLYFDENAPIFSAIDFATDRPDELWAALRGKPALTFAHHSAGEPVATNWAYPPDPELEPLTEITSVHGVSEAADAPIPVHGGIPGNFVRDVLLRGIRLGFIGSGDSHDGHPGLSHLVSGQSGLAAIFTEALDRPSLLAAMKRRRTFATNGIRPWLEVSIDETLMGGSLSASTDKHRLHVRYEATGPIERIDLVRSGRIAKIDGENVLSLDLEREIPPFQPGEFHYVRIIQRNGGVAWSSPIFVDAPTADTN